jgi:putative tryptophan/tyrosine transport system substrate-binding protein
MRRRALILGAGWALAIPLAARAQQKTVPIVGFLHSAKPEQIADLLDAFRGGLKESGFTEGVTLAIEYRWAENDVERLPALAAELVSRNVDVIAAAGGDRSAISAKQATSVIPIVAVLGGDPVAEGLVESLAHPGGNLTGVSFLTRSLTAKRLELLLEMVPQAKIVALLVNTQNPQSLSVIDDVQKAALAKGLQFHSLEASSETEIAQAFAMIDQLHAEALVIQADPYFNNVRSLLIALTASHAIPAIHERGAFAAEGGLMSYGTSLPDVYRQMGISVGKVLKGAKPSDLPVVQPVKFELIINLKTAKTLGLSVPQILLGEADEVIE